MTRDPTHGAVSDGPSHAMTPSGSAYFTLTLTLTRRDAQSILADPRQGTSTGS